MKKIVMILVVILVSVGVLVGCQKNNIPEEKVTKIIWQSEQDFQSREEYFNEVLEEKELPYKVDFVTKDTLKENQIVDLMETGIETWEKSYDMNKEILEGKYIPLDNYMETTAGKVIQDALPKNVWDTYKVNEKTYTILSVGFVPKKTVYIWDKDIAEKYNLHPETWNEKIWEYEDELLKVCNGEKGKNNFVTVQGLRFYSERLIEMTNVLGFCYPIKIREADDEIKAALLYEMPEYQEYLKGAKSLYEKGIYQPESEETSGEGMSAFLTVDTQFISKNAYLAYHDKDFWKTHEMKEVWSEPLWQLSCNAKQVGITVESKYPKKVFAFMCELYKDADLTNALMWGEEGTDYLLKGNTAIHPQNKGYVPASYAGNNLIGYAEVGQDEKKEKVYWHFLEECKNSAINGFAFSGKECLEELNRLAQIYWELDSKSGIDILNSNEEIIQKYKEAGIDQVIGEWNRQFEEWQKN